MDGYGPEGGYNKSLSMNEKYHCWAAAQYREKVSTSPLISWPPILTYRCLTRTDPHSSQQLVPTHPNLSLPAPHHPISASPLDPYPPKPHGNLALQPDHLSTLVGQVHPPYLLPVVVVGTKLFSSDWEVPMPLDQIIFLLHKVGNTEDSVHHPTQHRYLLNLHIRVSHSPANPLQVGMKFKRIL